MDAHFGPFTCIWRILRAQYARLLSNFFSGRVIDYPDCEFTIRSSCIGLVVLDERWFWAISGHGSTKKTTSARDVGTLCPNVEYWLMTAIIFAIILLDKDDLQQTTQTTYNRDGWWLVMMLHILSEYRDIGSSLNEMRWDLRAQKLNYWQQSRLSALFMFSGSFRALQFSSANLMVMSLLGDLLLHILEFFHRHGG